MQMKRRIESEKGVIAAYVLVSVMTFAIILIGIFSLTISTRKNQFKTIIKIKEAYEKNYDDREAIYQERLHPLITALTVIQSDTVMAKDEKGNQVVVPKGFKVSSQSGTTVQQGIVVEDGLGNQYVWIPVSNIDASGSNKIILDDNSEVEITLGRYTFDAIWNSTTSTMDGTGEATLMQSGSIWASETAFSRDANSTDWTVTELKDFRVSNRKL